MSEQHNFNQPPSGIPGSETLGPEAWAIRISDTLAAKVSGASSLTPEELAGLPAATLGMNQYGTFITIPDLAYGEATGTVTLRIHPRRAPDTISVTPQGSSGEPPQPPEGLYVRVSVTGFGAEPYEAEYPNAVMHAAHEAIAALPGVRPVIDIPPPQIAALTEGLATASATAFLQEWRETEEAHHGILALGPALQALQTAGYDVYFRGEIESYFAGAVTLGSTLGSAESSAIFTGLPERPNIEDQQRLFLATIATHLVETGLINPLTLNLSAATRIFTSFSIPVPPTNPWATTEALRMAASTNMSSLTETLRGTAFYLGDVAVDRIRRAGYPYPDTGTLSQLHAAGLRPAVSPEMARMFVDSELHAPAKEAAQPFRIVRQILTMQRDLADLISNNGPLQLPTSEDGRANPEALGESIESIRRRAGVTPLAWEVFDGPVIELLRAHRPDIRIGSLTLDEWSTQRQLYGHLAKAFFPQLKFATSSQELIEHSKGEQLPSIRQSTNRVDIATEAQPSLTASQPMHDALLMPDARKILEGALARYLPLIDAIDTAIDDGFLPKVPIDANVLNLHDVSNLRKELVRALQQINTVLTGSNTEELAKVISGKKSVGERAVMSFVIVNGLPCWTVRRLPTSEPSAR